MNGSLRTRFSKIGKLISVLKKCNGKAVVGGNEALISPKAAKVLIYCCLFVLVAALSAGMYFIEPALGRFIDARNLSQTLMLIIFVLSFVLAVKDVVSVLYMADDLELLLPMPLSAAQIVIAKLTVAFSLPVTISVVCMNSVCLGYGIREGAGVLYVAGILISSVLMPVTGAALATLLVVVFFRLFGFIRNRDLTVALGGISTFGITIAYVILSNSSGEDSSAGMSAALKVFSSVASVFPNISFMIRFMFEGSVTGVLVSLAFSAAVIMLSLLAVNKLYLRAALSMQNTSVSAKAVTSAVLQKVRKSSAVKALTVYEARSTKRNPAYLIYGFVMSFVWPVLFVLPFVLGNRSSGKVSFPLDYTPSLLAILFFAMAASCCAAGYNILAGTAFSREGSTFAAIRALPVDAKDYYRSKRNFALIICSLGSALYVIVAGIVCIIAGLIPAGCIWAIPAGAVLSEMFDLFIVNMLLLKHSRNPRLNWDSETEFSRKMSLINIVVTVAGVIALVACLCVVYFAPMIEKAGITGTVHIVFAAVIIAVSGASALFNRYAVKAGAKNLMKVEV